MVLLLFLRPGEALEPYPGHHLVQSLAQRMAGKLEVEARGPIAIAPSGDQDLKRNPLSDLIGDDFVVAVKQAKPKLPLIERQRLSLLLDERKLDTLGLIDPDEMRKLNRVSGARALVHIVVVPLTEKILVRALAWDVETAKILDADSVVIPRSPDLLSLLPAAKRTPSPRPAPLSSRTTTDIRYDLLGCKRKGRTVTCSLDLVSTARDQTIRLSRDTYITDEFGGRHEASNLNTGKKIGWKLLIKDVPARFRIDFSGVPSEVGHLKVFRLSGKEVDTEFRDIPVK